MRSRAARWLRLLLRGVAGFSDPAWRATLGTIAAESMDDIGDRVALVRAESAAAGRQFGLLIAALLAGAFCLAVAMLLLSVAVMLLFWETEHRMVAIAFVVGFWSVAALGCVLWARSLMTILRAPFAASAALASADWATLRRAMHRSQP